MFWHSSKCDRWEKGSGSEIKMLGRDIQICKMNSGIKLIHSAGAHNLFHFDIPDGKLQNWWVPATHVDCSNVIVWWLLLLLQSRKLQSVTNTTKLIGNLWFTQIESYELNLLGNYSELWWIWWLVSIRKSHFVCRISNAVRLDFVSVGIGSGKKHLCSLFLVNIQRNVWFMPSDIHRCRIMIKVTSDIASS